MGAIADALAAYAQPLLEQTDGSAEDLQRAFSLSTFCFNLALAPEDRRAAVLDEMRTELGLDDVEFDEFRQSLIVPMIRRHEDMFPQMHRRASADPRQSAFPPAGHARTAAAARPHVGIDRYAPCPCKSGKKFKFCCGAKGR
jgi:hypothetical protein